MGTVVFISYAMADSERLQIGKIAESLGKLKNIDEVLYWEGWNGYPNGNIIEFMETGVIKCDVFVAVFTEASLASQNCQKERDIAIFNNKRIVPLFESFELVPPACQPYLGINATDKEPNDISLELYELVNHQSTPSHQKGLSDQFENTETSKLRNKCNYFVSLGKSSLEIKKYEEAKNYFQSALKTCDEELFDQQLHEIISDFLNSVKIKRDEIVNFRGEKIKNLQVDVLHELESQIGEEFMVVDTIEHATHMGFSVNNNDVSGLGLSDCALTKIPESIKKLTSLQVLNLNNNPLIKLPELISDLSSLRTLYLSFTKLTNLPESFSNLYSLQILYIMGNKLQILPKPICNLPSLQKLDLSYTELTSLPDYIKHLHSLTHLELTGNLLTALPESFGDLHSLKKLDLKYNKLTMLPESIGNLSSLRELSLTDNRLKTLPESIGNLSRLIILQVEKNHFSSIPEAIKKLKEKGSIIITQ